MNRISPFGALAALALLLLPFVTSRHLFFGTVNAKYFFVIALTLLVVGIAAWKVWTGEWRPSFRNRPFSVVLFAALTTYWLATFLGVFPERSFFSDIQRSTGTLFLTHIGVLAYVLGAWCSANDWTLIRRSTILSAGAFGFFTILGVEGVGITDRIFGVNLGVSGLTFGNSTFAGTYLLLALVFAFIELTRTPRAAKWFYALGGASVLIALSPTLFNTGLLWGKTSIIGVLGSPLLLLGSARASSATALLLLTFFAGYVFLRARKISWTIHLTRAWAALHIIVILTGVSLLFTPGSAVQEKYVEASTGARLVVWNSGLAAFVERPLFGWGPENFERALQGHFDNRLYEQEFLGEIWFDRAHNVFVDTLVGGGVVGMLASVMLIGAFIVIVRRARAKQLVGELEAVLLYALPVAHVLQLQTGFDTVGSYVLLALFGGYALFLERTAALPSGKEVASTPNFFPHRVIAVGLALLILVSGRYALVDEYARQDALYRMFVETDTEVQLAEIQSATSRVSSFESLRFASASLIKGTLERFAERNMDAQTIEIVRSQLAVYEGRYREYIAAAPEHYRARMNFAYLLSVETILGEKKLAEAKEMVAAAAPLSPGNLLTPAMEALLALYSGDLREAERKAHEAVALNPNASFPNLVLAHIEKQKSKFPAISVLRLENI